MSTKLTAPNLAAKEYPERGLFSVRNFAGGAKGTGAALFQALGHAVELIEGEEYVRREAREAWLLHRERQRQEQAQSRAIGPGTVSDQILCHEFGIAWGVKFFADQLSLWSKRPAAGENEHFLLIEDLPAICELAARSRANVGDVPEGLADSLVRLIADRYAAGVTWREFKQRHKREFRSNRVK